MPRREILTSTERMQLLAFPDDEGELIRKYTLTKADLAFVRQHRGDHNGVTGGTLRLDAIAFVLEPKTAIPPLHRWQAWSNNAISRQVLFDSG